MHVTGLGYFKHAVELNYFVKKNQNHFIPFYLERRIDTLVAESNATPAVVGGSLSACLILVVVVAVLVIR